MTTPYTLPEDYDRIEDVDANPETDYSRQTFRTYNDALPYPISGCDGFYGDSENEFPD